LLILSLSPAGSEAATAPSLGTAQSFSVLAGSAVSNTGASSILGDVGLSPAGGAFITGLTCGHVGATIYDTNGGYTGGGGGSTACLSTDPGLLTTAKNSVTTAYNNAAGQGTDFTVPTELGGSTLIPGVYDSSPGTFGITGALTLDGQNDPDAVFIFKMASTLITADGSSVNFINGAQACNVFWQVGSSATLGTNSDFSGNILALTSITLTTGADVTGRLLAQNGAVVLDTNTINAANCSVASTCTPTSTTTSTPTSTPPPEETNTPVPSTETTVPSGTSTPLPEDVATQVAQATATQIADTATQEALAASTPVLSAATVVPAPASQAPTSTATPGATATQDAPNPFTPANTAPTSPGTSPGAPGSGSDTPSGGALPPQAPVEFIPPSAGSGGLLTGPDPASSPLRLAGLAITVLVLGAGLIVIRRGVFVRSHCCLRRFGELLGRSTLRSSTVSAR
jgi:type VI secretion system secreted protein VgrG